MFSSVVVFPIIAFAVALLIFKPKKWLMSSKIFLAILTAYATGVVMVFVWSAIQAIAPSESEIYGYDKVRIVALSTSALTEGSFFLGSGRIDDVPSYYFYYETTSGGKKLTKLRAESVTLYEEDRVDAFMERIIERKNFGKREESWLFKFFVPSSDEVRLGYAIHIPKGSIKEDIYLDLPR